MGINVDKVESKFFMKISFFCLKLQYSINIFTVYKIIKKNCSKFYLNNINKFK